ncbi:MAG: UbiA-like polyprenyltransferase [Cyanobacteriota bacterium]
MTITTRIKEYSDLVKFEHSIFALPFTLSGMLLSVTNKWPEPIIFAWVIIAMVGGRTAAMALNRIIDKNIDKLNPRTENRAIPAGRIKVSKALWLTIISLLLMILAVLQLPLICIYLLPVAIFIIIIYSYTKRFTVFSHFVLGFVLGSASIGGWLAVSGKITLPSILWGAAITFWVAGFDIIYSIQDEDFDKEQNLYSLPAKIGIAKSLFVSRSCHVLTVLLLFIMCFMLSTGTFIWLATLFTAVMLIYEQSLISANDLSKVNVAFFNINGFISIGFLVLTIIDKVI